MCEVCESEQAEPTEDLTPQPPEGYRWGIVGEIIPPGSLWFYRGLADGSAETSVGERLCLRPPHYCAFPIVPSDVSEKKSIEPTTTIPDDWSDNAKRLARYLDGLKSYDPKQEKTVPAIELVQRLYPNGFGCTDTGELYQLGFTGKRTPIRFRAFTENMKWATYSSHYDTFCERIFSESLPKIRLAFGDDIHDAFETHRPGSCMGGSDDDIRSFREVYATNNDCIGVIYANPKENPLVESVCSCLFWVGSKRVYLDRLYSSGTYHAKLHYDMFADYLEKKYGKPCVPIYTDAHKRRQWSKDITFKLRNHGNPLPYMDTIQNVKDCNSKYIWMTTKSTGLRCTDTSGTWPDGRGRCKCSSCGCRIDEDDAYSWNDSTYCEVCYSDSVGHCEYTEQDCDADDIQSIELFGHQSRYHSRRTGVYATSPAWHTLSVSSDTISSYFTELHDGRYAENALTIEDNHGRTWASDPDSWDDVVLAEDGELYHTDDVVQLSDGRTYPVDECVEVDGEWYLSGEEPEAETDDDDSDDISENEETTEQKEMVNP